MILFFDIEVFKFDWVIVAIDPTKHEEYVFINNREEFVNFYESHKNYIWIGYNSRNYDQYIVKALLCEFNPFEVSKYIIADKKPGYKFSRLLRKFPLNNYDVMTTFHSLKTLEGFMGNDIRETTVSFDLNRQLTPLELSETVTYCRNDVTQTMEVFLRRKSDFDAHLNIIKAFNLPLSAINKTKAGITALALGCQRIFFTDEWDISFVSTIKLDKYQYIFDWFKNPENYKNGEKFKTDVSGIPHVFGLGGIHGAATTPIHIKDFMVHIDVTSYYPSLMIEYDLLSRTVRDKRVFKAIYDKRVALKKAGKKKEQAPYKIILNSTFGITNDKYSLAYDPRRNHEVTINGQLLLLDLLEKLEGCCELIQSNTDGIIIQTNNFERVKAICHEWEIRTKMGLGFDIITELWQKDVNNYIFQFEDGKLERKGAYVKELHSLDNDLPIVNNALVNYMTKGVPIEKTIYECNELIMFQKIVKISNKYLYGLHNGERLNDKTFRIFASTDQHDTTIYKVKNLDKNPEKFAIAPDHCFIDNSDIKGKKVPGKLDKGWYVQLCKRRLNDFGIT